MRTRKNSVFGHFSCSAWNEVADSQVLILIKLEILHMYFSLIVPTVQEHLFQRMYFDGCFHDLFFKLFISSDTERL